MANLKPSSRPLRAEHECQPPHVKRAGSAKSRSALGGVSSEFPNGCEDGERRAGVESDSGWTDGQQQGGGLRQCETGGPKVGHVVTSPLGASARRADQVDNDGPQTRHRIDGVGAVPPVALTSLGEETIAPAWRARLITAAAKRLADKFAFRRGPRKKRELKPPAPLTASAVLAVAVLLGALVREADEKNQRPRFTTWAAWRESEWKKLGVKDPPDAEGDGFEVFSADLPRDVLDAVSRAAPARIVEGDGLVLNPDLWSENDERSLMVLGHLDMSPRFDEQARWEWSETRFNWLRVRRPRSRRAA